MKSTKAGKGVTMIGLVSWATQEAAALTEILIPNDSHMMEITPNIRRIKAPRHSTHVFTQPGLSCTHPHVARVFRTVLQHAILPRIPEAQDESRDRLSFRELATCMRIAVP